MTALTGALPHATTFLMDEDLVVSAAEGDSILRLPWFEADLFVGRQLPDILEMPKPVRSLCVDTYGAALGGARGRFVFSSYGHAFHVEAVPVPAESGDIQAVLAVARPATSGAPTAMCHELAAERFERAALIALERAERCRQAGLSGEESRQLRAAAKARAAAHRAQVNAARLDGTEPSPLTPREHEVLQLASHGLTNGEIADHLTVSVGTIKTHLQNVYTKLEVADKAAAVGEAMRRGLIE